MAGNIAAGLVTVATHATHAKIAESSVAVAVEILRLIEELP